MLRYAFLDIMRDRTRLLLTVMGIGIGVAQFVALFSFSTGLEAEFGKAMSGFFNRIIVTPRYSEARFLEDDDIVALEAYPEVVGVVRKLSTAGHVASRGGGTFVTAAFIDRDKMIDEITLERGTVEGAILGSKALERLRVADPALDVGSRLRLSLPRFGGREIPVNVGGVLSKGGLVLGSLTFDYAVVLPMEMAPQNAYDLALVRVDRLESMGPVAERIEQERNHDAVSFEAQVKEVITLTESFRYAFFLISAIAIVIASMSTINTMMITVIERTREIGILKALGFTRLEVVSVFILESLFIGVLGSVLGCVVGVGLSRSLVVMLIRRTGFGIVPVIDGRILVLSVLIGTLIAAISGAIPAKRAGDLDPLEALANE